MQKLAPRGILWHMTDMAPASCLLDVIRFWIDMRLGPFSPDPFRRTPLVIPVIYPSRTIRKPPRDDPRPYSSHAHPDTDARARPTSYRILERAREYDT